MLCPCRVGECFKYGKCYEEVLRDHHDLDLSPPDSNQLGLFVPDSRKFGPEGIAELYS